MPQTTFRNLVHLQKIEVTFSGILKLESNTFFNATSLTFLNLTGNKIIYIRKEMFTGLKAIRIIDLSINVIENIGICSFCDMEYLNYLDLSFNNLKIISTSLGNEMTKLYCNGNTNIDRISITYTNKNMFLHFSKHVYCCYFMDKAHCKVESKEEKTKTTTCNSIYKQSKLYIYLIIVTLCILAASSIIFIFKKIVNMKYSQKIIFQNLAVADMLLSVYVISICLYIHIYNQDYIHLYEKWRYSLTCRSIRSLVWISGLISKLIIFLLTISHLIITRYALMARPLSKKQICITLLVIWVIGHILFIVLTNLEGTDITCHFSKEKTLSLSPLILL